MEQKIVTRSDCDVVIAKCIGSDKFEVVNFKVKPYEDKEREYYKRDCVLEVSAKVNKNISRFRFFLKKFPTGNPALDELLHFAKASEREILFYEYFLPMLKQGLSSYNSDFVAQYLYGDIGRMMILEDMSLKFYSLARKANPHMLDRFHVSLALKAIAKLHAGSLSFEEKQKDADVSKLFDASDLLAQEPLWVKNVGAGQQSIESGLKGLEALLKEFQLEGSLTQLVRVTFETMQPQSKYRNVLGHGDLHPKNMLFKYDKANMPTECVLLNFGFCRYFLPAHDVLTVIFRSTTSLFRQHYFTYLIGYYHDCLHNELMKQGLHVNQFLPLEDFKQSINYLMPAIKLQTALHLEDFGAKPGFYKKLQKDASLYRTYIYEDKSPFMLELLRKDPIFKELIGEALEELLETLKLPQVSRENCYEILENHLETTVYGLKYFSLAPVEQHEETFELTMEVSDGSKEGASMRLKYRVQCGADNNFKVLNSIV